MAVWIKHVPTKKQNIQPQNGHVRKTPTYSKTNAIKYPIGVLQLNGKLKKLNLIY